jgi:acyl dehydratase
MNNPIEHFFIGQQFNEVFLLTEHIYKSFQECSKDMNPLHTDNAFAKSQGFHDRVMYGNILNVFISYFIGECLPVKNVIIHSQNINYKNPVYLNDTLRLEVIVIEIHESVNVIVFKFKYFNQHYEFIANGKIQIGVLT